MKSIFTVIFVLAVMHLLSARVSAQTITLSATDSANTATPAASTQYDLPYPGILPNHPFYFLKVVRDHVVLFLINDPVKKAEFNLLQSDKKIFAAEMLFEKDAEQMGVDVTDLDVYNTSLLLLESVYPLANLLPQLHKRLKYQLIESSEKIAPQIAEGFGKKKSSREFCRFLSMALGSSDEVITHIREIKIVAKTYSRINIEDCDVLIEKYKVLSKRINKLHSSWQKFS